MTATVAETTDYRLGVLAHAREVLERAVSECNAWTGPKPLRRVTIAMAALDGALRSWDSVVTEADKDQAIRMISLETRHVIALVKADMCDESAQFVATGRDWWEE